MRGRRGVEQLAALLDGDLSSDAASADNRRLVNLATAVGEHAPLAAPDPAFRVALRVQLIEQIDALCARPNRPS